MTIDSRPNVVILMTDQWRAQSIGYAGDVNAHTPVIDALAAESINYAKALAGTPVCCPSRASVLTGRYPLQHGVYINDVPLEPTGETMAETFASNGYRTAYIGKWHLYGSPSGHYERREAWVPPAKRFGFQYWKAAECTHDYNGSVYFDGDDQTPRRWPGYDAFAQTDDACRYLEEQAESDDPFLLFLSYGPPHFPLESAPDEYRGRYENSAIQLPPNVPAEMADEATRALRGYYAHIAALDDSVGAILATIDRSGLKENTVVVFTSDHGDMMGSQGIPPEQKLYPWEESIRVPLLIRLPGSSQGDGIVCDDLISSPDLFPTLLGICGIEAPESLIGTDFFTQRGTMPRDSALLSMVAPILCARHQGIGEYRGVRDQRYTFVRSRQGPWLLYDNELDPFQMHNRCGNPALAAEQARLDASLIRWLDLLGDEFLGGSEYLKRDGLEHYFEVQTPVGRTDSPWGDWTSTMKRDSATNDAAGERTFTVREPSQANGR